MNRFYLKTLLLCLLSFTGLIKAFAYDIAVENADSVTIYYNFINDSTELSVTCRDVYSYTGSYVGHVAIPDSVTYNGNVYRVTKIGDLAFFYCTGLISVEIPDGVTEIDYEAFYYCIKMTSMTIGTGVTKIVEEAFYDCRSLKKVIVPDIAAWCGIKFDDYEETNPLYYAKHIFSDQDTEITDLIIPDGVTEIGNYAFYGCSGLTSLIISDSVTKIGNSAFSRCSGLTSVTIPDGVMEIGSSAFKNCI